MEVTLWGTRGSVAVASSDSTFYGGNTTCVEVRLNSNECIIIDAGTGIRVLGEELLKENIKNYHILFTHVHWDHIQGLPFFSPLYKADRQIDIYVPEDVDESTGFLSSIFNGINFPLKKENIACQINIHRFKVATSFKIAEAEIITCPVNHFDTGCAYRISADGWTFMFTGDHEYSAAGNNPKCQPLNDMLNGVDVLLADGQYTADEYNKLRDWGHSCLDDWPPLANRHGVKHLLLTHHDPSHNDDKLNQIAESLADKFRDLPLFIELAREGAVIKGPVMVSHPDFMDEEELAQWLCEISLEFSSYNDVSMILDSILTEARRIGNIDAGTVYLADGNELVFAYTQNDTLFPGSAGARQAYLNARIPVSISSIAGYAAVTKEVLSIDDVRKIPSDMPYKFNDSFDRSNGYNTVSMLTIPLLMRDRLLGVLQLINKKNSKNHPVPFNKMLEARIDCLVGLAVTALQRGRMAKELILRMLQMSEMRDPAETANHVHRVGAMAAEIYHRWAERNKVDDCDLRKVKDQIRMAAMLHDVGKVAIPDAILKKPGRLNDDERKVMERHCAQGAELFTSIDWEIDAMACEIAKHHHQKYNGAGYTGADNVPLLKGDEIPLAARITALADVYDALISKRCYKDPMEKSQALNIIRKESGQHFDPEVVAAFMDIVDVIDAIHAKFEDDHLCF